MCMEETEFNTSKVKGIRRKRRLSEFFSMFVAVVSAFALNNWNENRRDANAEKKILIEIKNGLSKDIIDLKGNEKGHHMGLRACKVWNKIMVNGHYNGDSLQEHFSNLTRDFISVQNMAGYNTLKSNGLELIDYGRLRREVISLYEYQYNTLRKFEEEYEEMLFHKNYFSTLNTILAPHFIFGNSGRIEGLKQPFKLTAHDKNIVRSIILKIFSNRRFILQFYKQLEFKIKYVKNMIEIEFGE